MRLPFLNTREQLALELKPSTTFWTGNLDPCSSVSTRNQHPVSLSSDCSP